ncbi:hypothetical protein EYR38_006284 [Pleurotus pulmonarius]|nr:hypothetical protein EYR38_006284 [Pleurotus pulmonarius]
MQVAAARRTVSRTSATTANQSDADFWETIRSRDEKCVFTHWHGEACHTIPHTQGDETPNAILAREDVPQANINHPPNPADLRPQLLDLRYTLQFINTSDDDSCRLQCEYAPHNRDAKFMDAQPTSPPEPALLHYLYGAAILTAFGRSVPEWQAFGKQRQPRKESYPASRSFNKQTSENRALTRVKCDRVSPYPAESELAGGRRMTLDEAEEYMFNIASRQLAHREHARWAQRKLEINAWVSGCTEGNPGHTK